MRGKLTEGQFFTGRKGRKEGGRDGGRRCEEFTIGLSFAGGNLVAVVAVQNIHSGSDDFAREQRLHLLLCPVPQRKE